MEYDVFISCKSEDYIDAEEIYNFLKEKGFNVFLASKELRQVGDSEYRKAISQALKSTYHLIVFASKPENIDSTWVYYEWDWFLVAKIKGKKPGQLLTILKDISIDDVNGDLWKYESKSFYNYKDSLLAYVETPAYIERKEEEKRKEEERKRNERQKIIEQLSENAGEYSTLSLRLEDAAKKISTNLKKISITNRSCPVCGTQNELLNKYCEKCGWAISPLLGIPNMEYMIEQELHNSQTYKESWINSQKLVEISHELSKKNIALQNESKTLQIENNNLNEQLSIKQAQDDKILDLTKKLEVLKGELDCKDESLNELNITNKKLAFNIKEKTDEIYKLNEDIKKEKDYTNILQEELSKLTKENENISSLLAEKNKQYVELSAAYNHEIASKNSKDTKKNVMMKFSPKEPEKIKDKYIIGNLHLSGKKMFCSKEEIGLFVRKFCKNVPHNKDTVESLKINVKSLSEHLEDDYGIKFTEQDILACKTFSDIKNKIFKQCYISK